MIPISSRIGFFYVMAPPFCLWEFKNHEWMVFEFVLKFGASKKKKFAVQIKLKNLLNYVFRIFTNYVRILSLPEVS